MYRCSSTRFKAKSSKGLFAAGFAKRCLYLRICLRIKSMKDSNARLKNNLYNSSPISEIEVYNAGQMTPNSNVPTKIT
jgi:hypothetical protein